MIFLTYFIILSNAAILYFKQYNIMGSFVCVKNTSGLLWKTCNIYWKKWSGKLPLVNIHYNLTLFTTRFTIWVIEIGIRSDLDTLRLDYIFCLRLESSHMLKLYSWITHFYKTGINQVTDTYQLDYTFCLRL